MKCILLSILVIGALLSACGPHGLDEPDPDLNPDPDPVTVTQDAKDTSISSPSAREVQLQKRVDELEQKVELLTTVLNDWVSVMPQWFEVVENVREEVYGHHAFRRGSLRDRIGMLEDQVSPTGHDIFGVSLESRVSALEDQVALPGYHMPWDTVGGRIGDLEGRVEALEDEVFGFRW